MGSPIIKSKVNVEDGGIYSGTEAWNIAQYFTGFAVAFPLKDLNDLEDVARFGAVRLDDDMQLNENQYNKRRIEAVRRYWQKLRQLISDTLFKTKPKDRIRARKMFEITVNYRKYFDGLAIYQEDEISGEKKILINEAFAMNMLDKMVELKTEYIGILDRAGLIFKESDEVDLDALANEFIHGG